MTSTTVAANGNGNGSVIHDIGYKPYTGPRLTRPHIVRALYFFSLRSAFGFGRGARARIIPLATFGLMMLPAAISIYKVASVGGDPALRFDRYAYNTAILLIVFVAVAAPELVSRDLRHHTLPLYFSRPLRRADYPLAKLLALATAIVLFEAVPLIAMYLGIIASRATGVLFPATTTIPHAFESVGSHSTFTVNGVPQPPGGPVNIGPDQNGNGPNVQETITYDPIAREGGLIDPLRVVEGTRIWALHSTDPSIPDPQSTGPLYAVELLVLIGLAGGGLFLRY